MWTGSVRLGVVGILKIIVEGINRLIGKSLVIVPIAERIAHRPNHQGKTQNKPNRGSKRLVPGGEDQMVDPFSHGADLT